MKRCVLIGLLLVFLCGCRRAVPEYLISAIGVDVKGDEYIVCFEAVVVNTENPKQTLKLLKGKGDTMDAAVREIERQCTQPLLLSHCGVIAVGENVRKEYFKEIGEYCLDSEITLSIFFIRTKNPEKLFSAKPVSSACVGYDIMALIKQNKSHKNRFFEIVNRDYDVNLPLISLKEGGLYFENG